jgi:hypothetical protein
MRSINRKAALGTCLLFALTLPGYTIRPKAAIHEEMTRAAKHCFDLAEQYGNKPEHCATRLDRAERRRVDVRWTHDKFILPSAGYPNLEQAVRWPDDPTRQIRAPTIGKLAATMLRECEWSAQSGVTINDGLLCNSHHGQMQFLHAQASDSGEAASVTHAKIMAWAEFLYEVASGQMDSTKLDSDYCTYFEGESPFNRAMRPDTLAVPCRRGRPEGWNVATLFLLRCSNPLRSTVCNEDVSPSRYEKARIIAVGALLHLIQDSFSQSHCARGQCDDSTGRVKPVVECMPITMFTTYGVQDKSRHAQADRRPEFAPSCANNDSIDDPVTASAKVLWHVRHGSSTAKFREDFYRVFGRPETILASGVPSGSGNCFARRTRRPEQARRQEPGSSTR